jgi:hypothetical protein
VYLVMSFAQFIPTSPSSWFHWLYTLQMKKAFQLCDQMQKARLWLEVRVGRWANACPAVQDFSKTFQTHPIINIVLVLTDLGKLLCFLQLMKMIYKKYSCFSTNPNSWSPYSCSLYFYIHFAAPKQISFLSDNK